MNKLKSSKIEWIFFDLGNVILKYCPHTINVYADFLKVNCTDSFKNSFQKIFSSDLYTGKIGTFELLDIIRKKFNRQISLTEFYAFCKKEIHDPFPEIESLVQYLSTHYSLGIISNTFFGHWDTFLHYPIAKNFNLFVASHLVGCEKPNPKIFNIAIHKANTMPENCIFIDDLAENINSAKKLGFKTIHTLSPKQTIEALKDLSII